MQPGWVGSPIQGISHTLIYFNYSPVTDNSLVCLWRGRKPEDPEEIHINMAEPWLEIPHKTVSLLSSLILV